MVLICNKFIINISHNIRPVFSGLFLFFSMLSFCWSSDSSISKIEVNGLTKTKDYVIKREIVHPLNIPLDSILALEDRNRLFNLGLFDKVTWESISLNDSTSILQFNIIESRQSLPPIVIPSYNEELGWSLGGLFFIRNFQGKNRTLQLNGSIGAEKKIQFMFNDPWIIGNRISLSFYLESNSFEHLFLNRTVISNRLRFDIGKKFKDKLKIRFSPMFIKKSFVNDKSRDLYKYFIPEIKITYDSRDIYWSPKMGVNFINKFIPMIGENQFFTWDQSYSLYYPILRNRNPIVFAMNTTIKRKWGYRDDIWLNYFGNSFNIRGWHLPDSNTDYLGSEKYRFGHEYYLFSFELRKTVTSRFLTDIGVINGINFVCFFDAGYIGQEWNDLRENSILSGSGLGIRVPIPLIESIRVDLAWGLHNGEFKRKPVLHLALQQKF